jgi:hypothetical protein
MFLTGCKGTDIILYTRYTDFGKNYQFCGMLYCYLNQNLLRPFHSGEPVIVARGKEFLLVRHNSWLQPAGLLR